MSLDSWRKIQAGTGLIFGSYLLLHLSNTIAAHWGPAVYNGYMSKLRVVYQNPIVEGVLAFEILLHVASGFVLTWKRRNVKEGDLPLGTKLQRWFGWGLALYFPIHVTATRVISYFDQSKRVDFDYLSWTLDRFPYVFYPYYCVAGFMAAYHMVNGAVMGLAVIDTISFPIAKKITQHPVFKPAVTTFGLLVVSGVVMFTNGLLYTSDKARWPALDLTLPESIRPH